MQLLAAVRMRHRARPIRLIAIDIDGTLLDSKVQISQANLEALRRAHEAGIEIVLGTGRRHRFALPIAESLGFDLWLISSNGAVTRSTRGELFHQDLLPKETAIKLCRHMERVSQPHGAHLRPRRHGGDRLREPRASVRRHPALDGEERALHRIRQPNRKGADGRSHPGHVLRPDRTDAAGAARAAVLRFRRRFTVLRTQYDLRNLCIVDILNAGCSKGHALERWANYRGIDRSEVMAIGDNYNDIEMLTFAGHPVIMGNASDELKQNGWTITLHNDESGVAAAIEQVLDANAASVNA